MYVGYPKQARVHVVMHGHAILVTGHTTRAPAALIMCITQLCRLSPPRQSRTPRGWPAPRTATTRSRARSRRCCTTATGCTRHARGACACRRGGRSRCCTGGATTTGTAAATNQSLGLWAIAHVDVGVGGGRETRRELRARGIHDVATAQHTLAIMFLHRGMWRSAAFSLNVRPQLGHGTNDGSGAEAAMGGGSLPTMHTMSATMPHTATATQPHKQQRHKRCTHMPAAFAALYSRAARMASRKAEDFAFHFAFFAAAAPPTGGDRARCRDLAPSRPAPRRRPRPRSLAPFTNLAASVPVVARR